MADSVVLSTLNHKAHKIPEYNVFVLDLTNEKNNLNMKIEKLKRLIGA